MVGLLGLVGTPPTAVFVGKLTAVDRRLGRRAGLAGGRRRWSTPWLSLFYYLRWIAPVVARADPAAADDRRPFAEVAARPGRSCEPAAAGLMSGVLLGPLVLSDGQARGCEAAGDGPPLWTSHIPGLTNSRQMGNVAGGGRGIRTHETGGDPPNGFQDRPLYRR